MSSETFATGATPEGNKPVNEISDGPLKVAIWSRDGEHGPFYSATGRRRYNDKVTAEWKDGDSYGQDDLLALAELIREAYAWVRQQRGADAKLLARINKPKLSRLETQNRLPGGAVFKPSRATY